MRLIHSDSVFSVPAGQSPDYEHDNPLMRLFSLVEQLPLAEERDFYLGDHLQFLVPFDQLELYAPMGGGEADPTKQDNKEDFQKQNLRSFLASDTALVRGLVALGDQVIPFLRLTYRGGPDSKLAAALRAAGQDGPRESVQLWLRVGSTATATLTVPYHPKRHRYEVELWGVDAALTPTLANQLGDRGREALARGELQLRADLLPHDRATFTREALGGKSVKATRPGDVFHPVLPLPVEVAWADATGAVWDSRNGENYQYSFNMKVRGWDSFLEVGVSDNPHGGLGTLEYRNLLSNYFGHKESRELSRTLPPWSFDAHGNKGQDGRTESFMAVDYMDLHLLDGAAGIGLHRHRDNQEVFMVMAGRAWMVVGDWCKLDDRERCFEIRLLRPGHLALLKGGQLHGLLNPTDAKVELFMFGGYD